MNKIDSKTKQIVIIRDNFSCQKCGYKDKKLNDLEVHHIIPLSIGGKNTPENLITLCSICHKYAPNSKKDFLSYINEKVDGNLLRTFRNSNYSISQKTKAGMERKAKEGGFITKAPRGYKIVGKLLVPSEDSEEIKRIFQEFLDFEISLTKIAKKYGMTPAGMKKLLKNTTYIGKIRFIGQEIKGQHKPILEKQLFEQVQEKIEKLGWS